MGIRSSCFDGNTPRNAAWAKAIVPLHAPILLLGFEGHVRTESGTSFRFLRTLPHLSQLLAPRLFLSPRHAWRLALLRSLRQNAPLVDDDHAT